MGKSLIPTPTKGRCEVRAFEVIYDDVPDTVLQAGIMSNLCQKQYGLYKGFSVMHTKTTNNTNHLHLGLILRDKPRNLKWTQLKEYFTVDGLKPPTQHGPLKCKSKDFDKKLQTYFDYTQDEFKHPDQLIGVSHLHRWKPKSADDKLSPSDYLTTLIRTGMTGIELDELIVNPESSLKVYKEALRNYDVYIKMIDKQEEILGRINQAKLYKVKTKTYRPFQQALTKILDDQNDRNIHCHYDDGDTGKNYFVDVESMRPDTLILQSAETKRIAHAWNPKVHKRIIFDIPRDKMAYLNTTAIEKLKNGTLFSTMHYPKMKKSLWKPKIIIMGNEPIDRFVWTEDRLTASTTTSPAYNIIAK